MAFNQKVHKVSYSFEFDQMIYILIITSDVILHYSIIVL